MPVRSELPDGKLHHFFHIDFHTGDRTGKAGGVPIGSSYDREPVIPAHRIQVVLGDYLIRHDDAVYHGIADFLKVHAAVEDHHIIPLPCGFHHSLIHIDIKGIPQILTEKKELLCSALLQRLRDRMRIIAKLIRHFQYSFFLFRFHVSAVVHGPGYYRYRYACFFGYFFSGDHFSSLLAAFPGNHIEFPFAFPLKIS